MLINVQILHLKQTLDHVIVEIIVVQDGHEECDSADEHALHTTDVGQVVEDFVAVTRNCPLVQIHLDSEVHEGYVVSFVCTQWLLLNFEDSAVFQLSKLI